jgi:hypothetical protein
VVCIDTTVRRGINEKNDLIAYCSSQLIDYAHVTIVFLTYSIALMEDTEMHSMQLILTNIIYDAKMTLKKPFLKKIN